MESTEVLVIGGGIQGVGVAQCAAAMGYEVTLLEESGLASGTSSRSSKLIHGGLRYLESAQLRLVHESLSERATLLKIAPELVKLVPFHIPIYRGTKRRPWQVRAGLSLYALLGHLRESTRFSSIPKRDWDRLDGLRTDSLLAVFRYHDGQTDDAALTRAVSASSVELGARTLSPARFLEAHRKDDGWRVTYSQDGSSHDLSASVLVNAGGPWVERIRAHIHPEPPGFAVDLVGGTHIEVEGRLERGIYYTEAPSDRRAVFMIPWKDHLMVGTTEQPYEGDPRRVEPLAEEIEYLQSTLLHYFPKQTGRRIDAWAGLRVLPRMPGRAFDRPREVTLVTDVRNRPSMVAIYGGKLTGYRATAEKVMRLLQGSLPRRAAKADTSTLRLHA